MYKQQKTAERQEKRCILKITASGPTGRFSAGNAAGASKQDTVWRSQQDATGASLSECVTLSHHVTQLLTEGLKMF